MKTVFMAMYEVKPLKCSPHHGKNPYAVAAVYVVAKNADEAAHKTKQRIADDGWEITRVEREAFALFLKDCPSQEAIVLFREAEASGISALYCATGDDASADPSLN